MITSAWKCPLPRNGAAMLTPLPLAASMRCTSVRVNGRFTAPVPPATHDRERTRLRSWLTVSSRSGSAAPASSATRAR